MTVAARLGVLIVLLVIVATGCGGTQTASKKTEESTLKALAIFYGQFMRQNQGKPPANEEELKKFFSTLTKEDLAGFKIDSVDQLMVSNRDNQPYVIIYGVPKGPPAGPGGSPIIAYEKTGVGGKRYVASSLGGVEEVDEAKFKTLVPDGP